MSAIKYNAGNVEDTGIQVSNQRIKIIARSIAVRSKGRCACKTFWFGVFSIISGLVVLVLQPTEFFTKIKFSLLPGGECFGLWQKPNVDFRIKIFIFNITNKEAFLEGREKKLRLKDEGPYYYRFIAEHLNPRFNRTEGTVLTDSHYRFEWAKDLNTRSEDEIFELPNIMMLLSASHFSGKNPIVSAISGPLIRQIGSVPIIRLAVKDFLYGVESSLITIGNTFAKHWIPFEKFALFEQVYGLEQETFTTYTGEKNYRMAGRIAEYNNRTYLPQWQAPCNNIVGASDGKKYGSNIEEDEILYLYHRTLCRTLPLKQAGPPTYSIQNIPTVPYKLLDDAFESGDINENNKCYCRDGNCLPSGLIDLSPCFYGFTTALSYPHFYKGHPSLLEKFDGLNPTQEQHDSIWHINTATGIPTNCSVKLQINLVLKDTEQILDDDKFSNMVLPLAWCEVTFTELNPETALRIFFLLRLSPILEKIHVIFSIVLGILCMVYAVHKSKADKISKRRKPTINDGLVAQQSLLLFGKT